MNTREPNANGTTFFVGNEFQEYKIRSLQCALEILDYENGNHDFPFGYAIAAIRKEIWKTFDEMTARKRVYTTDEYNTFIGEHQKKPLAPGWERNSPPS